MLAWMWVGDGEVVCRCGCGRPPRAAMRSTGQCTRGLAPPRLWRLAGVAVIRMLPHYKPCNKGVYGLLRGGCKEWVSTCTCCAPCRLRQPVCRLPHVCHVLVQCLPWHDMLAQGRVACKEIVDARCLLCWAANIARMRAVVVDCSGCLHCHLACARPWPPRGIMGIMGVAVTLQPTA
jgi:hypothetical protein